LEGGATLCAWFEGIPSFHDAILEELELRQGAPGALWRAFAGWGAKSMLRAISCQRNMRS